MVQWSSTSWQARRAAHHTAGREGKGRHKRRVVLMVADGGSRSTWTVVDGMRVHARRRRVMPVSPLGSVVLVHGLGVSSRYMLPTLDLLARRWDVVAPDLPGFGLSEKPCRSLTLVELAESLAGWLAQAGLRRPVLLGNSLGCQVISTLAQREPQRVRAAVLVGPTMDPSASGGVRALGRLLADAPRERPREIPVALGDYRRAGARRIWETFTDAVRAPVAEQLRGMRMPTLVVRAAETRSCLPAGRGRCAGCCPTAGWSSSTARRTR